MVDDRGNIIEYNSKHSLISYVLLYDSNRELELNCKFDCRFTGPVNNSWISTRYFEDFAKKRMNQMLKGPYENLTEFEWFSYSHLASFEMCLKMKNLGFNFNWDNYIKDDCYFQHKNTIEDTRIEIFKSVNTYNREELSIDFSEYHNYNFCLNYSKLSNDNKNNILFQSSIYQFLDWLIDKEFINIIDKNDYIMFYKVNRDKVHLERTSENEVEWKIENFREAIDRIFKII